MKNHWMNEIKILRITLQAISDDLEGILNDEKSEALAEAVDLINEAVEKLEEIK